MVELCIYIPKITRPYAVAEVCAKELQIDRKEQRETSITTQAFPTHQDASGFSFALHRGGTFFLLNWYMSFACGFWYKLILISLISSVLSARMFQQIDAVNVDIAGEES